MHSHSLPSLGYAPSYFVTPQQLKNEKASGKWGQSEQRDSLGGMTIARVQWLDRAGTCSWSPPERQLRTGSAGATHRSSQKQEAVFLGPSYRLPQGTGCHLGVSAWLTILQQYDRSSKCNLPKTHMLLLIGNWGSVRLNDSPMSEPALNHCCLPNSEADSKSSLLKTNTQIKRMKLIAGRIHKPLKFWRNQTKSFLFVIT